MASIQRGELHQPESQDLAYLIVSIYSHAYLYTVDLPPMAANATVNLVVDSILSHASTPFPATVKQSEPQRLKFETEALVLTPYPTLSQRIKIRFVLHSVEALFPELTFLPAPPLPTSKASLLPKSFQSILLRRTRPSLAQSPVRP